MLRSMLKSAVIAAALAPLMATLAPAQDPTSNPPNRAYSYGTTDNGVPPGTSSYGYNYTTSYVPIQASLYPCPRPDVPHEVGWTLITNPALAPHEMLYAHRYRALYPPYYYHNKGGLACLPFFPKPPLKGTEVTVKYKSCCGPFSYKPPFSRVCYSNSSWNRSYGHGWNH